jgi:uncharacterized membrane protein
MSSKMTEHSMTRKGGEGRHSQWFLNVSFSTIALVAMCKVFDDAMSQQARHTKWALSGLSIALALSVVGVLGSIILKDKFYNTAIEGIVVS